ncbi:MAG: recombinase family protein [Clostridiaceae bacterium]|nr:recombinase family protein [Clostridiaceae bacterium]
MARYGYMKLDVEESDVSRQALLLDPMGDFDRIFVEQSNKNSNKRDQRKRMLSMLEPGDLVFAAAADRFADNSRDFLISADKIISSGAELVLLQENLDTRSPSGRQAMRLLTAFAEIDYKWQSDRKKQGIKQARSQGRRIGRPPVAVPPDFRRICEEWSDGKINGQEAAAKSGLRSTSFYKKAAELGFKAPSRHRRNE